MKERRNKGGTIPKQF